MPEVDAQVPHRVAGDGLKLPARNYLSGYIINFKSTSKARPPLDDVTRGDVSDVHVPQQNRLWACDNLFSTSL